MQIVDAAGHPDPATAKAAGFAVVAQYLGGANAVPEPWVDSATAAGEGIISIWEVAAQAAAGGSAQGQVDGAAAVAAAKSLGQPAGTAIYLTCDFDAEDPATVAAVSAYFLTGGSIIRANGFLAGAYGGTTVLNAIGGIVDRRWQSAGWTNGQQVAGCALSQLVAQADVAGVTCDLNLVLGEPGAWNKNGPVLLFPPPPVAPPLQFPVDRSVAVSSTVQISGGWGWLPSPYPAGNVYSATALGENPEVAGHYDSVPTLVYKATQAGPNSPNGALVYQGPQDGVFGVEVMAAQ